MGVRIAQVALDCRDAEAQASFWCAALDWVVREREGEVVCVGPRDGGPGMDLIPVADPKVVKNRLHLDLRADGATTAEELDRLLGLGARRADVGQAPDVSWTVLADPEGNEFCLLGRAFSEL